MYNNKYRQPQRGNKMENKELAIELGKRVKQLIKKDSSLSNAIFWEFIYEKVEDAIEDDLTKMYLLNRYMMDIRLGGLRVIRDRKKINNEGDYYTITGAQHIIAVRVPELPVAGSVVKEKIYFDKDGGVNFTDRRNIFDTFCKDQKLTNKKQKDFKSFLQDKLGIDDAINRILSADAMKGAADYVLRNKICFQAKWNGVENVKALLNDV